VNRTVLRVTRERIGDAIVLHAAGEVDIRSAQTLREHLDRVCRKAEPPQFIVADLTEVRFLGSAGLAVLLEVGKRCQDQQTPLRVVANRPGTLRPLQVTGIDRILEVAGSLEHVVRSA
jgi:anti-sigma B factor antagonist